MFSNPAARPNGSMPLGNSFRDLPQARKANVVHRPRRSSGIVRDGDSSGKSRTDALVGAPALVQDVAIDARAERDFIATLCSCAPRALATVPAGNDRTLWACIG
ncbi:MAG: hypothetical protein DMG70_26030 [Acidobacteria bacterium]|nr:MAG: hypothetical protein DMG70_26030 [Acidobacteriota bacterium]PYY08944.1 MAG: hypothetical protein DMG69_12990 [Acidobacteriota bacterium]